MYRKLKICALAFLAITLISGTAHANIYKDAYTAESTTGNWTYDGAGTHTYSAGSISLTTGNIALPAGSITQRTPLTLIHQTPDTVDVVATTSTGYTFVLTAAREGASDPDGPWEFTLPTAATGLTYTFTTATAQTMRIRPYTGDHILYETMDSDDTLQIETGSSGTCVTLVAGGVIDWYVVSMQGEWKDGGT